MKDTLRDNCDDAADCVRNCCVSPVIAPIFFVIFVLMAQFVLVNVVVAVLMKHLEESHKQMEDELDMDTELERELEREQEFEEEQALCMQLDDKPDKAVVKKPLVKVASLPSNFTYTTPMPEKKLFFAGGPLRRQTLPYYSQNVGVSVLNPAASATGKIDEVVEQSPSRKTSLDTTSTKSQASSQKVVFKRPTLSKRCSVDESKLRSRRLSSVDRIKRGKKTTSLKLPHSDRDIALDLVEHRALSDQGISQAPSSSPIAAPITLTATSPVKTSLPPPPTSVATTASSTATTSTPVSAPHRSNVISTSPTKKQFRQLSLDCDRSRAYLDAPTLTPSPTTSSGKSYLSVPKRSRSGSSNKLFKQVALDEDGDENSLLLASDAGSEIDHNLLTVNGQTGGDADDGVKKSESCEILRIISERRKV
jgi:voltage-dependent calcium channel T type alpha-1G